MGPQSAACNHRSDRALSVPRSPPGMPEDSGPYTSLIVEPEFSWPSPGGGGTKSSLLPACLVTVQHDPLQCAYILWVAFSSVD